MQTALLLIHAFVCFALIGLVLLQRGKGSDIGAAFGGGASNTVFGSQGPGNFLSRTTAWLAVLFFVLCLVMTRLTAVSFGQPDTISLPSGPSVPVSQSSGYGEPSATQDVSVIPE